MKPVLALSKADKTQVGKTNITCSFSAEASSSISSDVSAYPAITAETSNVSVHLLYREDGGRGAIERWIVGYKWFDGGNGKMVPLIREEEGYKYRKKQGRE